MIDCPVMTVQGQGINRQGLIGGPSQHGRVHTRIIIVTLFSMTILRSLQDLGVIMIRYILQHTTPVNNKTVNVHPEATILHSSATIERASIGPDSQGDLTISGENEHDELMHGRDIGLRQDEHSSHDL